MPTRLFASHCIDIILLIQELLTMCWIQELDDHVALFLKQHPSLF
jgi:hypothetical protein